MNPLFEALIDLLPDVPWVEYNSGSGFNIYPLVSPDSHFYKRTNGTENRRLLVEWSPWASRYAKHGTARRVGRVGGVASPSDLDDFRMPVMDGYEAIRRIKVTVRGRATVIIALTASVFEDSVR